MFDKAVHIPKFIIAAHATDSPARIAATEATLLETDLETIGAVQYKLSVGRGAQMKIHKDVEERDAENF